MISVVIQAGGASRRMGEDKALMQFLGTTLIERVINRVRSLGDELLITTNNPEKFKSFQLPLYEDLFPGTGALGGLYTALRVARFPIVSVVACDMPFVNPDILKEALNMLIAENTDLVIPRTERGYEPLHAVYRRRTCMPAIHKALQRGERRLISWFSDVTVSEIPASQLRRLDPMQIAFDNLNTQEDFRLAEELARKIG